MGPLPDQEILKRLGCLSFVHHSSRVVGSCFLILASRFLILASFFLILASCYSSIPSRIAATSTVVQRPLLSPMADWVIFIVRTILLEIR